MNGLALAIAFSVASAAGYAAGAVVQERVAAYATDLLTCLREPRWWLAVALNGAGAGLHVAALAFGPLSIVQPLGLLTLVLALPLGAALVGRRVAGLHWQGAGLTVAGLGLLVLTAPLGTARELTGSDVAILLVATGAAILVLIGAAQAVRRTVPRSILHATASGIAFATASALTQTVSLRVTEIGPLAGLSTAGLGLAAMAACGLLLAQAAYRGSGLGAPLATVSLANPAASAGIGMLLLGERFVGGVTGAGLALAGAALAIAGVVLLARPATKARGGTGKPGADGTPAPGGESAVNAIAKPVTPGLPPIDSRGAVHDTAAGRARTEATGSAGTTATSGSSHTEAAAQHASGSTARAETPGRADAGGEDAAEGQAGPGIAGTADVAKQRTPAQTAGDGRTRGTTTGKAATPKAATPKAATPRSAASRAAASRAAASCAVGNAARRRLIRPLPSGGRPAALRGRRRR